MATKLIRISPKSIKALRTVNEELAAVVEFLCLDRPIKSFQTEVQPAGYSLYLSEGYHYTAIYQDANKKWISSGIEAVAAHNIGGAGMRHEIGAKIPMPQFSYLVTVFYRCDANRPWGMTITAIGGVALPEAA